MAKSARKFAELLTEAVHRIRIKEGKTIQIVHDELGYALGREGGSAIEYWRKGHVPPYLADVEKLAREIILRSGLDRKWLENFLRSSDHPYPTLLCDELFPTPTPNRSAPTISEPTHPKDNPIANDARTSPTGFNPFVVGPPVTHPRHFFGREYELRRIFGLWKRLPLQNVALMGLKRSGKTSLLHYLKNITTAASEELRPHQRTDWLPQPETYRWIFVDFQDVRMCHRERLLHYLLTQLEMPIPEPCDLENFLDLVSLHLDKPTIILMDEIGAGLASPELDLPFWGSLRSLESNLTGGNLAFLLTAHKPPAQLAHEEGKPSPFFNIFGHTFTLGPLTKTEARQLVGSSPQPFDSEDVEWILMRSERWPCLLQILCHARLMALEYNETGDAWKKEGLRQMAPFWHLLG